MAKKDAIVGNPNKKNDLQKRGKGVAQHLSAVESILGSTGLQHILKSVAGELHVSMASTRLVRVLSVAASLEGGQILDRSRHNKCTYKGASLDT